jgi:hypothetical protein
MLFLSHNIQAQQNSGNGARVYDPNKSQEVQRRSVQTPFGPGIPESNFGYFVNENSEDADGNNTYQQQVMPQKDKTQILKNALLFLQQLQVLANSNQNTSSNGEVLIDQIAQAIQQVGEQLRLQDKIAKLHGVYKNNPQAAQELISSIIIDIQNLLQIELQQNVTPMNNMGFFSKRNEKNMKKVANLKEIVRQHFDNFAVSDIQIISKLQFLNAMLNDEGSPPEEPREYTRPQVDKESEHFSELHGTGGIDTEMTKADIKSEISELEDVLKSRGYTNEDIDEVVAVINENQRSQKDIVDEDDIGSREDKGYSNEEEERFKGIIHGDEQVTASKIYFSKKAQSKFIGDYVIEKVDDYIYKVKRDDGMPFNNDDEKRIEGIMIAKDYENAFVNLTDKDEEGYYTVYVGYPEKQHDVSDLFALSNEKMQKTAALPGMTVGPTTGKTVWCPKTKEPIEEYLCWNVCRDGIKIGEKVVCGKRIFDAMVSDNNERALNRTSVFPQNKEDAIIAGPNYRLPDDTRRSELRDVEIPTERRLQELQKTFPSHDNTREWNHTPTLSDDKKHDWSQKVTLSKNAQKKFNKQAQDIYNDYLSSLDTEGDEDYKDIIRKIIASIQVDVSEGTVVPGDVLAAVDRAVDVIQDHFGNSSQAYSFLLSTLGDVVFRYIDDDLGRQILYVIYSQHPEIERMVKSAYRKNKMKKEAQFTEDTTYSFPEDSGIFYEEVTKPRTKQMRKQPEESYLDYATRIMSIIQEEGMGGRGWTGSEAASALVGTIPYPTDKQFIPVIHKVRQFLENNFGKDAMLNLAAMWVSDYWDPSRIDTNLTARKHIKNHFPEAIRLYTEFHPDFPDKKDYDEEDERILDRIYREYPPIPNPDQYLTV